MKKKLLIAFCFIAVFVLGCVLGSVIQHLKTGYWKTDTIPLPDGEVTHDNAVELERTSYFDPDRGFLSVKTKYGYPLKFYMAKRMFQEASPHVQDVHTATNQVTWKEGLYTYQLTVTATQEKAEHPRGHIFQEVQ